MKLASHLTYFSLVSIALVACSSDSSSGRATSQIEPSFTVDVDTTEGGSTYLSADLEEPGSGLKTVELDDGDTITATSDLGSTIALDYDSTVQIYSTTLQNVTNFKTVTFRFNRASGTPALNTTITLPDAIALTSPAPSAQVSAASGNVQIAWTNSIANATARFLAYPCGSVAGSTDAPSGPDTGSFSLPVSSIVSAAPTAAGQCITIHMQRDVQGTIDPAFAQGGTFTGSRSDYVDFLLTP